MSILYQLSRWKVYGKSIVASLVLIATAVQAVVSDTDTGARITQAEGVQIAIALANAALIYLVPNIPQWPWSKTVVSAFLAALQLLTGLIIDGISAADVASLIIAALMVAPAAAPAVSTTALPSQRG